MEKMTWAALRDLLANQYEFFKWQLTRRLGSEELASESLQETWLRLYRYDDAGPVRSPAAYVMRVALNIAADHRRAEERRGRRTDSNALVDIADPAPGPAREAEGRFQVEILRRAIDELPDRTRKILSAARLDGQSQEEIAKRFGISTRMVRVELRRALDHCESRLRDDFLSERSRTSIEKPHHPLPPSEPTASTDDEQ